MGGKHTKSEGTRKADNPNGQALNIEVEICAS
jgi:hypothetical protein